MTVERLLTNAKDSEIREEQLQKQLFTAKQHIADLEHQLAERNKEVDFLTADKRFLKDQVYETQKKLSESEKKLQVSEETRKDLAVQYVKLFCSHLEVLDDWYPEWRHHCKVEIEQLTECLQSGVQRRDPQWRKPS